MSEFLAMGGYAGFVWPAYGLSAAVMIGLLVAAWRRLRRAEADLARVRGATDTRP